MMMKKLTFEEFEGLEAEIEDEEETFEEYENEEPASGNVPTWSHEFE